MMTKKPLVALISATPLAIPPAEAAMAETFCEVEIWNLLDDRLMTEAALQGGLTPELAARMETLIDFAIGQGADAVLLTCSLYGSVADGFVAPIPVLAPDRAVFDDVTGSSYQRILVVASFEEALKDSAYRLGKDAAASGRAIEVTGVVATAAMTSAKSGNTRALVDDLAEAVEPASAGIDAVLLAQYSLAPAREDLERRLGIPVLSGPSSAAVKLRDAFVGSAPRGVLGAIADDYTGAVDVADALRSAGLRTLLFFGLDAPPEHLPEHDAIVIALKTRSVPAAEAVEESLTALDYLQQHRADQIYFKYCSTFDSTPEGNIGPVLTALAERLDADMVVTTPSSPHHARTVYSGQLFVGGVLLEDSHMAQHPLNPMTDSLLPRLLAAQTDRQIRSLSLETIRAGIGAIDAELGGHAGRQPSFVVADGITQDDLDALAVTQIDRPLVAGAAGFALAMGRARARRGDRAQSGDGASGNQFRSAVLAGSCSASTLEQISRFQSQGFPSYQLTATPEMTIESLSSDALRWYDALEEGSVPLFYSSVNAEELARIRAELDGDRVAAIFEQALASIAVGLRERGVDRFVVAGGETSGTVTQRLHVTGGIMGGRVDDGVAWLYTAQDPPLALLLKSGNFGDPDLFLRSTDPERAWGEIDD
ncbi:3-oxo-tetronate kinase [Leifsonella bigeumensis]